MKSIPDKYIIGRSKLDIIKNIFLSLVISIFIFSFAFNQPLDFDLGWHLRYGRETFETKKISRIDTFTFTNNGTRVGREEWLPEIISYFLYSKFSFIGLSLGVGILTSLAFVILILPWKASWPIKFFITFFVMTGTSNILLMGPRIQNFSWLFFSLLYFFLLKYEQSQKKLFLIPIPFIFFLWKISHPGYLLGFVLVFYFFCFKFGEIVLFMTKKNSIKISKLFFISLILILSLLFIFFFVIKSKSDLNYYFDLIKALLLPIDSAVNNTINGQIRVNILEWFPPIFFDIPGAAYLFGLVFSVSVFLLIPRKKINYKYLFLLLIFIYFSTLARRNLPYFFLISLPIIQDIMEKSRKFVINKNIFKFLFSLSVVLFLFISIRRIGSSSKIILASQNDENYYCKIVSAPCGALNYIKSNNLSGNMFNEYRWGGYLEWKYPQIKTFIDGRYPGGPIFESYDKVITLKNGWEDVLYKYKISYLIVPFDRMFDDMILAQDDWKRAFADDDSAVYLKKSGKDEKK